MHDIFPFLAILAAIALGAASPGPSFVYVARTAVALSRPDGVAAALGMGIGGITFAALALLGLQAVLAQIAWLYAGLKLAGGLYLLLLAFRLWRGAGNAASPPPGIGQRSPGLRRSFLLGLATQLSNPKTAVAYASIFAALLPPAPPLWMILALPPLILLIETSWYTIVALVFSAERPRAAYLRSKRWIDRLAASVIGLLGLRLLVAAGRYG
jgi:threonine/homoserine/homoserine lactone efflux protein